MSAKKKRRYDKVSRAKNMFNLVRKVLSKSCPVSSQPFVISRYIFWHDTMVKCTKTCQKVYPFVISMEIWYLFYIHQMSIINDVMMTCCPFSVFINQKIILERLFVIKKSENVFVKFSEKMSIFYSTECILDKCNSTESHYNKNVLNMRHNRSTSKIIFFSWV